MIERKLKYITLTFDPLTNKMGITKFGKEPMEMEDIHLEKADIFIIERFITRCCQKMSQRRRK